MITSRLYAARARGPHPSGSPWAIVRCILRDRLIILGGLMLACMLALAALSVVEWVIRTPAPPTSVTTGAVFVFVVAMSLVAALHLRTGRWARRARYPGAWALLAEVAEMGATPLLAVLTLPAFQMAFVFALIRSAPIETVALIGLCIGVTDATLVYLALSLLHGAQRELARLRDEVRALQEERDGHGGAADYHDHIWSSGA